MTKQVSSSLAKTVNSQGGSTKNRSILLFAIGKSLFTLFALLTYAYHYLMKLIIKIKTLNIERAKQF